MLHAAEGASAADRRAERAFEGDLFIGGPFGVHFRIGGGEFGDFGGGGAGVAGNEAHVRLKETARDGFVAEKQSFHVMEYPFSAEGTAQVDGDFTASYIIQYRVDFRKTKR